MIFRVYDGKQDEPLDEVEGLSVLIALSSFLDKHDVQSKYFVCVRGGSGLGSEYYDLELKDEADRSRYFRHVSFAEYDARYSAK